MVLRVTLDWLIGQDILDRCNDQMKSIVSHFPFLSFAYLGVQQARSCSTYFFVSTACYSTLYFSFPTELTSKEYLLFKDFFLLFCLFCIHSELGQIKKKKSNFFKPLKFSAPAAGKLLGFSVSRPVSCHFSREAWKTWDLRNFWGSLQFLKFFYFLPKPEQIGSIRAFWLGKYWTEHVFTKLKLWIYC